MLETIKKYLPSKELIHRFGYIILAIIFILAINFGIRRFNNGQTFLQSVSSAQPVVVADLVASDHDKDGVPDWEEKIWGTDPDKADTNGDGVSDGEEVARRKGTLQQEAIAQGNDINDGGINETEQFSRDFFTAAATLSQAGEVTQDNADALADKVAAQIETGATGTLYTLNDIKKSTDASTKAVLAYDAKIKSILKRYPADKDRSILIVYKSLDTEDQAYLKNLDPIYQSYVAIVNELLAVSVPPPLQSTHVRLVNVFATARNNIAVMRNLYDNPTPAFSVMLQIDKNTQEREATALEYQSKIEPYYK